MADSDKSVFHGIMIGMIDISMSDGAFWFQPYIVAKDWFSCEKCGNTLGRIIWGMRYINIDDELFEYRKSILQIATGEQVTRLEVVCECGHEFVWEPTDIFIRASKGESDGEKPESKIHNI